MWAGHQGQRSPPPFSEGNLSPERGRHLSKGTEFTPGVLCPALRLCSGLQLDGGSDSQSREGPCRPSCSGGWAWWSLAIQRDPVEKLGHRVARWLGVARQQGFPSGGIQDLARWGLVPCGVQGTVFRALLLGGPSAGSVWTLSGSEPGPSLQAPPQEPLCREGLEMLRAYLLASFAENECICLQSSSKQLTEYQNQSIPLHRRGRQGPETQEASWDVRSGGVHSAAWRGHRSLLGT